MISRVWKGIERTLSPHWIGNSLGRQLELCCYLKWINFRVDKVSRIEDPKFSRGLYFANQPVFDLISFIFLGVLAKISILKISRGQNFAKIATKVRENRQNYFTRNLIHLRFLVHCNNICERCLRLSHLTCSSYHNYDCFSDARNKHPHHYLLDGSGRRGGREPKRRRRRRSRRE